MSLLLATAHKLIYKKILQSITMCKHNRMPNRDERREHENWVDWHEVGCLRTSNSSVTPY